MKSTSKAGIYSIMCLVNGHSYIGKSIDLEARKKQHFEDLAKNNHVNKYLQNAYNKYGKANFSFEILEIIEDPSKQMLEHMLAKREQELILELKPEYNIMIYMGDELDEKAVQDAINRGEVLILKSWQKYKPPEWVKWVYGGEKNPLLGKGQK